MCVRKINVCRALECSPEIPEESAGQMFSYSNKVVFNIPPLVVNEINVYDMSFIFRYRSAGSVVGFTLADNLRKVYE